MWIIIVVVVVGISFSCGVTAVRALLLDGGVLVGRICCLFVHRRCVLCFFFIEILCYHGCIVVDILVTNYCNCLCIIFMMVIGWIGLGEAYGDYVVE